MSANLTDECSKAMFDQSIIDAENINYNEELQKTCAPVIQSKCANIKSGGGRIIDCLTKNHDDADFPRDCKESLHQFLQTHTQDFRQDYGLFTACQVSPSLYLFVNLSHANQLKTSQQNYN